MGTVVRGAVRVQWEITRHNLMDYYWLLLIPIYGLIFMSIFVHSGRTDLLGYALVGPLLVAIGQMGFYAAGELLGREREAQTLELQIATPTPLFTIICCRVGVVAAMGLVGFVEAWLVARLVFGVSIDVYHPTVLIATLIATMFASIATSVLMSALFALNPRRVRSLQNTFTTPLYVLSGVVVPVAYLPTWIEPFSRIVFLSWSADLLRDSLRPEPVDAPAVRLAIVLVLGLAGLFAGAFVLRRMLDRLRTDGALGL
jgi:ABC-2 type transport system permease protein